MEQNNIYTYENREKIYNDAKEKFLQGKPFEINDKICESLIEVMYADVAYLHSCLEDVKEIIVDDGNGKRKEVKVGNTPLNIQLATTINTINKRILEAEKLKRELGNDMQQLVNKNKQLQEKLDEESKINGYGSDELLNESETVFKDMKELLNKFVESDAIAIQFVEYRNLWTKKLEAHSSKYDKKD